MHRKHITWKLLCSLTVTLTLFYSLYHYNNIVIAANSDELPILPSVTVNYGDANSDEKIDTKDAVLMKKYLANYKNLNIDIEACDVNHDGRITSSDAVKLLKYLAGYSVDLDK